MKNKTLTPKEQADSRREREVLSVKVKVHEGQWISSGITQPHNAKKEGLGPNTKR